MNTRLIHTLICLLFIAPIFLSQTCFAQTAGTLDSTFNNIGYVTTPVRIDDDGEAITVAPDGKIVVVGASENGDEYEFTLIRYLANGAIDPTFGNNGTVVEPFDNDNAYLQAVAIQPDGKILSCGYTEAGLYFIAFRHHVNGTLDSTFSNFGYVTTNLGGMVEAATDLALHPDGKLILSGISIGQSATTIALVRYNPDGSLDSTFNNNGILNTLIDVEDTTTSQLLLQPDGKIVTVGTAFNGTDLDFTLGRFMPDGSLDASFDSNGYVTIDLGGDEISTDITIDGGGNILVSGIRTDTGNAEFTVAKILPNGAPDLTFASNGAFSMAMGISDAFCNGVACLGIDSILLAGDSYDGNQCVFTLLKLNGAGVPDTSFGNAGIVTTRIGDTEDLCNGMILQPDGKILLVGESSDSLENSDIAVARYISSMIVGLEEFGPQKPGLQVFPHPIQENTVLEYEQFASGHVSIRLTNLQGKQVKQILFEEFRAAGTHRELIQVSDLPSGIYLLHLDTPAGKAVIKVWKS